MLIVVLVAFLAAGLTLFSGFGLGSLLLPAFALLFPLSVAVAATGVVHLLNNLFKAALLGRYARLRVVFLFGVPGAISAYFGAKLLGTLVHVEPVLSWRLGEWAFDVTPLGITIGLLILIFAALELHPQGKKVSLPPRYLPLGGLLSGFLGGLSGHQGALRTTFMIRLGLPKEAFLGTSILCAVVIDIVRLTVYALDMFGPGVDDQAFYSLADGWKYVAAGAGAAFFGSYLGRIMIDKVTMDGIRKLVGIMLLGLGLAISAGLVG